MCSNLYAMNQIYFFKIDFFIGLNFPKMWVIPSILILSCASMLQSQSTEETAAETETTILPTLEEIIKSSKTTESTQKTTTSTTLLSTTSTTTTTLKPTTKYLPEGMN